MQTWSWISFVLGVVAMLATPLILKIVVALFRSWRDLRFEQMIRRYAVYKGEVAQPYIDALVTLIKARTSAEYIIEVDVGTLRLSFCEHGFCPGLKFVPKYHFTQTFFLKDEVYFLIFCHKGEKEKFIKMYPDHVLEKEPFEFCGENPLIPPILKYRFSG